MQIEPSFLFQLAVGACALLGFVWRYNLYVEKKIEQHRAATEAHISASETKVEARVTISEAKVEAVRVECAKREDLHRIEAAVTGVHERIDQIYTLMLKSSPS